MRRTTALSCIAGATLVLALSLAGCQTRQSASGVVSTGTLSQAAVDLVTRTGGYYAQEQSLDNAETTLVDNCVRAAGFAIPATPATPVSRDEQWRPDLAERTRDGYGLLNRIRQNGSAAPDPIDRWVRTLPPARQQQYESTVVGPAASRASMVVNGTRFDYSTRGCLADARTRIYGGDLTATRVAYAPQFYYIELLTKAQTQSPYIRALSEWSGCMRRSGYRS